MKKFLISVLILRSLAALIVAGEGIRLWYNDERLAGTLMFPIIICTYALLVSVLNALFIYQRRSKGAIICESTLAVSVAAVIPFTTLYLSLPLLGLTVISGILVFIIHSRTKEKY